jgi:aspartyl-tRNA(Asn)/glutamyl-tRNA(Gln) amidotransferase subunit C
MPLSREEAQELALLARLGLSAEELERLRRELDSILGYVEKLRQLDTAGVPGTTHAVPMDCPLRQDKVGERLATEQALHGAPRTEESFFEVPRIIGAEDGE